MEFKIASLDPEHFIFQPASAGDGTKGPGGLRALPHPCLRIETAEKAFSYRGLTGQFYPVLWQP